MRLALAATIALLTLDQAVSHEHWINLEKLHDPVTKVWCCDETDCFAQPAGEVTPAPGGYSIRKPVNCSRHLASCGARPMENGGGAGLRKHGA